MAGRWDLRTSTQDRLSIHPASGQIVGDGSLSTIRYSQQLFQFQQPSMEALLQ